MFALGKAPGRSFSRRAFRRFCAVSSTVAFAPHVLSMNFPAFLASIFASRSEMTLLNQKQCLEELDALIIPRRISSSVTREENDIFRLHINKMKYLDLGLDSLLFNSFTG